MFMNQQLQGHEGYLSRSYKRYTERELAEAYQKGVGALLVFETPVDLSDVHEEIAGLKDENQKLKKDVDSLRMELLEVKFKQIQEMQKKEQK